MLVISLLGEDCNLIESGDHVAHLNNCVYLHILKRREKVAENLHRPKHEAVMRVLVSA
jgi:hypothetical protein